MGVVITVTGPSGSGKSTLIHRIMEKYPDVYGEAISHTTRKPRPGEVHGKDYIFVNEEEFDQMVENEEFLETVTFAGRRYGSAFSEARLKTEKGHALVVVEPHGKEQWQENWGGTVLSVFLDVNEETCCERMAMAGRDAADIQKRIMHDRPIFNVDRSEYDLCLANRNLEAACESLVQFVEHKTR